MRVKGLWQTKVSQWGESVSCFQRGHDDDDEPASVRECSEAEEAGEGSEAEEAGERGREEVVAHDASAA
jgi:hypothetical protein